MSNFVVIGSSNKSSVNRSAVFREIVDGGVPGARYLGIDALFRGGRMLYRAATDRRLLRFTKKHPRLRRLYERAIEALYRGGRRVSLRRLRPLLSDSSENYLIFCTGTRIDRLSAPILQSLRASCPRCHLIYYLVDSIERTAFMNGAGEEAILDFLRMFDAAYTYDRADAAAHGDVVRFVEIPLWRASTPPPPSPAYELYFCGKDKRRRELLMSVRERVQSAGLRCHYRLVRSPTSSERRDAALSEYAPYEVTVAELLQSNCVLEVLAVHNSESTLRYKEAVIYNKKLLTTNPAISALPYYDSRWMRTFQTAEDIDLDWLRAVERVDYGYRGDFSASAFLRRVEALTP